MRPYARDWVNVGGTIEYSKELHRWYDTNSNITYDELSANHNGITGMGAQLKQMIKQANKKS